MSAADTDASNDEGEKRSKLPLTLGLVAALAAGGASFFAAFTGAFHGDPLEQAVEKESAQSTPAPRFVELDPMLISLGPQSRHQYLQFQAQLEVNPTYASEVSDVKPRIVDVLNGYLRAVNPTDLETPSSLVRLRSQMLRRIQVVAGPDRVNDLLIMEFVLN